MALSPPSQFNFISGSEFLKASLSQGSGFQSKRSKCQLTLCGSAFLSNPLSGRTYAGVLAALWGSDDDWLVPLESWPSSGVTRDMLWCQEAKVRTKVKVLSKMHVLYPSTFQVACADLTWRSLHCCQTPEPLAPRAWVPLGEGAC